VNKIKNKKAVWAVVVLFTCLLLRQGIALAQTMEQTTLAVDNVDRVVTRGEAVHSVVQAFDLANQQKNFIKDCLLHLDECFFAFSARSDYDEIRFQPLILYPDVFPAYKYYKDINLASMLGVVQGYLDYKKTPFKPEDPVSRIQVLKIVLVAANLVPWKEKFELSQADMTTKLVAAADITGNEDKWWYARYLNFALDSGIITEEDIGLPDEQIDNITLGKIIEKTSAHVNKLGANGNVRKSQ
jgi:hypothetical protein